MGTILGAAVGALLGAEIGRSMDERDHACFGHALEIGTSGRRVAWTNPSNGWRYEVVPGNGFQRGNRSCRHYTLLAAGSKHRVNETGVACLVREGVWELLNT